MKYVVIILILLSVECLAFESDSIRSERREAGLFVIHEVEEEETLYSLARRYRSSVKSIIEYNEVVNNRIEIGQILEILVLEEVPANEQEEILAASDPNIHIVKEGETLYSIARAYDIKIRDLRKLNNLENNSIALGQPIRIRKGEQVTQSQEEEVQVIADAKNSNESVIDDLDYNTYLVQTGETLLSIAKKLDVSVEALRVWNSLNSDYLRIGQEIRYSKPEKEVFVNEEPVPNTSSKINEDGFERVYEEGIAGIIENISTKKYLALHKDLPIGTELEVRNLMNNFTVHVKIVGKLPNTGINKDLLLRLSQPAYEKLGILDPRSRVEVSYFKE